MISVAAIVKNLMGRSTQNALAGLEQLTEAESAMVKQAVAELPAGASVDLSKLVERARAKLAEDRKRKPAPQPWKYSMELMADDPMADQLLRKLRRLLVAGMEVNAACRRVHGAVRRMERRRSAKWRPLRNSIQAEPAPPQAEPKPNYVTNPESLPTYGPPHLVASDGEWVPAHTTAADMQPDEIDDDEPKPRQGGAKRRRPHTAEDPTS